MKDELARLRARLDAISAAVANAESRLAAAQPEPRTDPPAAAGDTAPLTEADTQPEEKASAAVPETAAKPKEKPAAKKRSK